MKELEGIKNILFDLGGVLLNIDFKKTYDAFAALGIEGAHELNERPEVLGLFMDLECGLYDKDRFLSAFREIVLREDVPPVAPLEKGAERPSHLEADSPSLPKEGLGWIRPGERIRDEEIIAAFNALLLDFVPEHIALVQELRKKYRVFLLSNTNAIHAECYNARLKENFGIENLDHLMEKAFYSHDLGCRKPGEEIYLKALEMANIVAEETLFIDDSKENVEAAVGLGIEGIRVTDEYTILDIFR